MWWRGWKQQEDALLSPLHSTAQHVHGDIWQSKAWTIAQLFSWLCPSLLSHGTRQGRGRRKMGVMDKEVNCAMTEVAGAYGLVMLWGTAVHRISHEQGVPSATAIEWVCRGCKDCAGPGTTAPGLWYCSPLPETCMVRHPCCANTGHLSRMGLWMSSDADNLFPSVMQRDKSSL